MSVMLLCDTSGGGSTAPACAPDLALEGSIGTSTGLLLSSRTSTALLLPPSAGLGCCWEVGADEAAATDPPPPFTPVPAATAPVPAAETEGIDDAEPTKLVTGWGRDRDDNEEWCATDVRVAWACDSSGGAALR